MKFQVGDIVTYKGAYYEQYIGKEGKIVKINDKGISYSYDVKFYDRIVPIWEGNLELKDGGKIKWYYKGKLESKLYESDEFEVGDIVTYHGGGLFNRYGSDCEIISNYKNLFYIIKFLSDNFEHECDGSFLKLKKIDDGKVKW